MNPFFTDFRMTDSDDDLSHAYQKNMWRTKSLLAASLQDQENVDVFFDHLSQSYFVKMGNDELIKLTREAIEESGVGTKEYLDYLENKRRGRLIREATNKSIKKNKDYAKHLSLEMTDKMSTDDSPPATEAVATCRKFEFSSEDTLDFVSPPLSFS